MARKTTLNLTAVRRPVRLQNGKRSSGLRFMNLVVAEKDISGVPSAGPRPRLTPALSTYDADGYDKDGRSSYGYDRDGFFGYGWHIDGYNREGRWFDANGFNRNHVHEETGTYIAPDGRRYSDFLPEWDADGFGHDGFDVAGMNSRGFGRNGLHEATGTIFDSTGFDEEYCDTRGFDEHGFNVDFYSDPPRSPEYEVGWHRDTKTCYSPEGFDIAGLDVNGVDSTGMFWEQN